ncbi:hypothetical protein GQ54DRAFT_308774 [Martensiomyces pterosporus]|nr:hypothetical protein GQ54DRAFT_308774 [Martensiomyces pterosporus]
MRASVDDANPLVAQHGRPALPPLIRVSSMKEQHQQPSSTNTAYFPPLPHRARILPPTPATTLAINTAYRAESSPTFSAPPALAGTSAGSADSAAAQCMVPGLKRKRADAADLSMPENESRLIIEHGHGEHARALTDSLIDMDKVMRMLSNMDAAHTRVDPKLQALLELVTRQAASVRLATGASGEQ